MPRGKGYTPVVMSIVGRFVLTVLPRRWDNELSSPVAPRSYVLAQTATEIAADVVDAAKVAYLADLLDCFGAAALRAAVGELSLSVASFDRHFDVVISESSGDLRNELDDLASRKHLRALLLTSGSSLVTQRLGPE